MVSALAFSAAGASAATPQTSNGRAVNVASVVRPQTIYGPYLWNYYDTVTECDNYGQYGVNTHLWYSYYCQWTPDQDPHYGLWYYTID